jgi:hypothetical protein
MNTETREHPTISNLKRIFKDRERTNSSKVISFFGAENFCYIEQEGEGQVIFRLNDSNGKRASITVEYRETAAWILATCMDEELNSQDYIASILLEATILAFNQGNEIIVLSPNIIDDAYNLRKVMQLWGARFDDGVIYLELRNEKCWPASALLSGAAFQKRYNEIGLEADMCPEDTPNRIIACGHERVPYFIVQEEDKDSDDIDLLLEDSLDRRFFIDMHHYPNHCLVVVWIEYDESLELVLVRKMIDRTLLLAFSAGIQQIITTYAPDPRTSRWPHRLTTLFESYGFTHSKTTEKLKIQF